MNRKNRWERPPKTEEEPLRALMKMLGVSQSLASLLLQRNIDTYEKAKDFFCPKLDDLYDPFLMKDMQRAVERILRALEKKQGILIYGDYDVDGTTSVAMMYDFLKDHTNFLRCYIPDRYQEGYGLSYRGIDAAHHWGISLIIALDCGIKDLEQTKYACRKEIDLIICDHHLPGQKLPEAFAVLDPKRPDCSYPFKELSGCGIGFKLIQALAKAMSLPFPDRFLDLVALSTASDLVPIVGENRILTFYGLERLNQERRPGVQAIKPDSLQKISTNDILFSIGPKINAAGRLEHAKKAVQLLLSQSESQAKERAFKINGLNQDRKDLDKKTTKEALELIKEQGEEHLYTTVVFKPHWNQGILGIVASRLTEVYHRPTVVFTQNQEKLVASARSIEGFDLYHALERCSSCIEKFGGHKYAAGLTLAAVNFENFKSCFEETVKQITSGNRYEPKITIDYELDLSEIDAKFVRILKRFEPFGNGNKQPVFLSRNLVSQSNPIKLGVEGNHLKMQVRKYNTEDACKTAIGFGWGHAFEYVEKKSFDMVYIIKENFWRDNVYNQLIIKDLRFNP